MVGMPRFCSDFGQILARFLARFLTRVLARCFGVENTVYSSTGTEKYSFTGSEEKGEKNIHICLHCFLKSQCLKLPCISHMLTWIGEFRPGNKTICVVFDEESVFLGPRT